MKCDPPVGSTVAPEDYMDKLVIVFDGEAGHKVTHIAVIDTKPRFPFVEKLDPDGLTLNIWFREGYTMPYDTQFEIMLVGRSGCMHMHKLSPDNCLVLPVKYSFSTTPKD